MIDAFKPRFDILPPSQQRLWLKLKAAVDLGFVLYDGTAIALRVGHRPSVDFDFFTEKPLDREALRAAFPFLAQSTVLQDELQALSVLVPHTDAQLGFVKLSFLGTIGFGRVGTPDLTEDGVMQVASLDDLIATKVKVVPQRAEAKDYRDIEQMLKVGVSLSRGLAAAREMFGPNFQPSENLKALVYFADGDLQTLTDHERSALVKAASTVRGLPSVEILSKQLSIPFASRGV